MNFKPILFSTEMVKAILNGSKVQTRRVVKPQPADSIKLVPQSFQNEKDWGKFLWQTEQGESILRNSPYGQVGDVLWVRETWLFCQDCYSSELTRFGRGYYLHKETGHNPRGNKWKPSIHMPKEACRLFLKIKSIRVERLNDITEGDACLEGVELMDTNRYKDYIDKHNSVISSRISFATLWQSINGEESWNSNPWVWVIGFERIEKPEGF